VTIAQGPAPSAAASSMLAMADPPQPPGALARAGAAVGRRVRTLPDRHGGPYVLGALGLVLVLGLGIRLAAALDPPPLSEVGNDAHVYMRIAESLYELGSYGPPTQKSPSDWSPGAPLFYGAVYYVTGGVNPGTVLVLLALLGVGTMLFSYLIARRLGGPVAGVIAALLAATYPSFVENAQRMLAEPVALFVLPGAVLAFLWASDGGRVWRWLLPGFLLGFTALTRPEYVPFVAVFAVLAFSRVVWLRRPHWRAGLLGGAAAAAVLVVAFVVPLAPWTARNYVVLDRFVPVTTGGGKALFVATYLPGSGRQQKVKRKLIDRYYGKHDLSYPEVKATEMAPLLNRVAKKYPAMRRDAALGRIGRENFVRYATGQPVAYARMVLAKVGNMWDRGSTPAMSPDGMFVYHRVLLALAGIGIVAMAIRRRWEVVVIGLVVLGVTAVGGLTLAVPRRALPLMPLVLAFTSLPLSWALPRWGSAREPEPAAPGPRSPAGAPPEARPALVADSPR
jgi:4-amino-4-deoxy-L-arabinose transferase-like glycosyltransferase